MKKSKSEKDYKLVLQEAAEIWWNSIDKDKRIEIFVEKALSSPIKIDIKPQTIGGVPIRPPFEIRPKHHDRYKNPFTSPPWRQPYTLI